ncbi:MAG: M14 family metallopeptidase, partial [bacterium]
MIKRVLLMIALAALPMTAKSAMDYTHWAEGAIIMIAQDLFSSKANAISIGESSRDGISQLAIKYGLDPDEEDDATKNAVLFECGMHAREWYAAESCYWLMDYLYRHYQDEQVQELLSEVDVWIIPQSNPAGRDLDDPALGDPTEYTYVCKGGVDSGSTCDLDSDCSSGDCYSSGWRTNANKTSCDVGVDLARNFSSGWNSAAAICDTTEFMKFRGDDPFSEVETLNLRRFIHNHMISMVLIQHAQSEEIDHRWRSSSSANDHMVDELVSASATASASWSPDPSLAKSSVGGGYGQFSAWLTGDSDVSGELDDGTKRNIPTFFFELPISPGGNYYGTGYQDAASDGSNTFHPSGDAMQSLWEETILELLTYVTRQARSPSCPVDSSG